MREIATHLPLLGLAQDTENVCESLVNHIENPVNGILTDGPNHKTPAEALPFIKDKLKAFLGGIK